MSDKYLSVTDTAKLVRNALKDRFPKTKFSVRSKSYSGGASIDVHWTDGPTDKEVRTVTSLYAGGRFDGMIDLAYSAYHWMLPDGTVVFAGTSGHSYASENTMAAAVKPHPDAKLVHFGADYVFTHRKTSRDLKLRAAKRVVRDRGLDLNPTDLLHDKYDGWSDLANGVDLSGHGNWLTDELSRMTSSMRGDGLRVLEVK